MFGLKKFARSESGVAVVEFGIWLAFGVPLLLTSVDFALYNIDRINTNKAIN